MAAGGPEPDEGVVASEWLCEWGLMPEAGGPALMEEQTLRRYVALSKCAFGDGLSEEARKEFLQGILPYEHRLEAAQTNIGCVDDPRYLYRLALTNTTPILAKPMRLRPEEEA